MTLDYLYDDDDDEDQDNDDDDVPWATFLIPYFLLLRGGSSKS